MQTLIRSTGWLLLAALLFGSSCATSSDSSDSSDKDITKTTVRFLEQATDAQSGNQVTTVTIPKSGLQVTISPYPVLSERNVLSAEVVPSAEGAAVMIQFDPHGSILLNEVTTRNRGRYLVVSLNGKPTAAWLVDQPLTHGQFLLDGNFTEKQAKKLADALKAIGEKQNSLY